MTRNKIKPYIEYSYHRKNHKKTKYLNKKGTQVIRVNRPALLL